MSDDSYDNKAIHEDAFFVGLIVLPSIENSTGPYKNMAALKDTFVAYLRNDFTGDQSWLTENDIDKIVTLVVAWNVDITFEKAGDEAAEEGIAAHGKEELSQGGGEKGDGSKE